ncbi:related to Bacillus licheniformis esterase [Ramularia collo-cygni]|uniref:Related to Bacillus licheniformis esterase n=1 Tax=Ramularia collo-cygni TaxID=112498 RepID=A0A2D3VDD4_9PEZI|nr:related to Bacillus licheniformis esterase [Ramularia collo-cygni]CZT19689.1 related to Bacillus licheniformis esterase [Ramularia collo-cygni]
MMDATATTRPASRRALADLQYNSIIADQATSSDEESPGSREIRGEQARTAIGVSIGREQTRFTSPNTPANEKAAAIEREGGFFGTVLDGTAEGFPETVDDDDDEEDERESAQRNQVGSSSRPGARIPSPWRVPDPRQFGTQRSSKTKSILHAGFFGRKRSWSGPDSWLSSLPKGFTFSSSREQSKEVRKVSSSPRRSTLYTESRTSPQDASEPESFKQSEEARAAVGTLPTNYHLQRIKSGTTRPPQLRRSTSDNSLVTQRTLSMVSSLGDDTRFEHISEQVNSRFKAIKDSLQDSKINLPSMPSISSFSVSSFTPDFMNRERSNSLFARPLNSESSDSLPHRTRNPQKPVDPLTRQPYSSAKAAMSESWDKSSIEHPHFSQALEQLEGDVVILGGYRGSILRSAEPPHRQLWVPIKVGLNLRKVDLELAIDEDGDERATETVIPGGMLSHIGPIDISRRLFKRLRSCENARSGKLRVHDYGYDWRLHPAHLSAQLLKFLQTLPSNQPGVANSGRGATVLAHSLGGLITRHAVNQRPELFRGVVYAGVPTTCVNILGPLRNGDEVLMSSRVLTAQVNFTIRTSFALLPLDGRCFFDKTTKEEYPVDFFDPQTWIDNRLSPCVGRPLPPLSPPPKPTGISGYVNSVTSAFPSFSLPRRKSVSSPRIPGDLSKTTAVGGVEAPDTMGSNAKSSDVAMASGNIATDTDPNDADDEEHQPASVRTAVTLPREEAIAYLTRTLATVKKFKEELFFDPKHDAANLYPPIAVIYGKDTPTVFGAKIDGREGMKHADSYDELAFASGDGVVLAKAAMAPEGYKVAKGGVVSSERGHVTLLGDMEAVGKCLNAIIKARRRGVGVGSEDVGR